MRMHKVIRAYGEPGKREGVRRGANGRGRSWGLAAIVAASLLFWSVFAWLMWQAL
ncbi:hypothetical protein [Martelella endophytica]|uniref:hypothetical protein n=1 Tax=Martelella endophytica TaxID=1486262 RepID=UPI00130D846B|nr:hypothetical protein [Martelella endophytica]